MMVGALPASALLVVITRSFAQQNTNGFYDYHGFNGHEGYGGRNACVPGYDADCVNGPNGPSPSPVFEVHSTPEPEVTEPPAPVAPVNPDSSSGPGPTLNPDSSSGPGPTLEPQPDGSGTTGEDCTLKIPADCVFPFKYKGLNYQTCTGVDAQNTMWCSTDRDYKGKWKQCVDPCKNKWPVKAIVSSVVAGGVAATGIGLIAAAVDHSHRNPGQPWNPFAAPALRVGGATPAVTPAATPAATPSPVAAAAQAYAAVAAPANVAPAAPAIPAAYSGPETDSVLKPATDASAGVMVRSIPVAVPARKLGQTNEFLPMPQPRGLQASTVAPIVVPVEVDVPVNVVVTEVPPATTMGPQQAQQRLTWAIVLIVLGVCLLGCVCSIGAAYYGGFGKKKRALAPQDDQAYAPQDVEGAGYPQAYQATE